MNHLPRDKAKQVNAMLKNDPQVKMLQQQLLKLMTISSPKYVLNDGCLVPLYDEELMEKYTSAIKARQTQIIEQIKDLL